MIKLVTIANRWGLVALNGLYTFSVYALIIKKKELENEIKYKFTKTNIVCTFFVLVKTLIHLEGVNLSR